MHKNHKDPQELDLTQPRLAWYKQKTWIRHQDIVYWVDIQLAQRKGLKFHQTRSNAIILYDTLPAYCISKVVVKKSQKLRKAARTPNESNQSQKPNYQEQGDLFWQSNHPVRVLRKSTNVSYLAAKAQTQERGDQNPSRVVCQCLLNL